MTQGRSDVWTPVRVLAAVLLLGACSGSGPWPGWSAPRSTAKLAERYCYRTLAEVDCHARPLPGEDTRRVGFFDAPYPD